MLGEIQRGWMLALRVFQSCLSVLADSFIFRELWDSAPHTLPFFSSRDLLEKNSGQRIWAAGDKQAQVGSMPACLAVTAERIFACPLHSTWSASLRCERHNLVWCEWWRNRWQPFFIWQLRTRRSHWAVWLTPPSYRRPLHVTPDSERMTELMTSSWQRLSMSSGTNGLRWGDILILCSALLQFVLLKALYK